MYQGKYTLQKANKEQAPPADAPLSPQQPRRPVRKPRKPQPSKGTVLFYSIFLGCVALFLIAVLCIMGPLRDWLVEYEASQPSHKKNVIFTELFLEKNWERVYELSHTEDNAFENKDTFAAYMDKLVGDGELTCIETSAGLSGNKKYIVKLGEEKLATFTLTGGSEKETEIPQWELGSLELLLSGDQSVTVELLPGQTAYINGVALDDRYTIRTISTPAEKYLSEGLHGYQRVHQQVTGLLTVPKVTVKDASGTNIPVTLNAETGLYQQTISQADATTEEKQYALDAVEAYALYMIRKVNKAEIANFFDSKSQIYKTITSSEVGWMQSYASYRFTEPSFRQFYRYSDSVYSIFVDITLEVVRGNGSVKEYDLANTLFLTKNSNGKYMVTEMTNIDVQQKTEQVRLTFVNEGSVLSTGMVDANANKLALPTVTAPDGKVFAGWVTQGTDENGKLTLTMVFEPSESKELYLPEDFVLAPMTLYAHYEEVQ